LLKNYQYGRIYTGFPKKIKQAFTSYSILHT